MVKVILRNVGVKVVVTAVLSELLKESAGVTSRRDGCCYTRGTLKEVLLIKTGEAELYTFQKRILSVPSLKRPRWNSLCLRARWYENPKL